MNRRTVDEDSPLLPRSAQEVLEEEMPSYVIAPQVEADRSVPGLRRREMPARQDPGPMRWRDRLILDTLKSLVRHKFLCLAAVTLAAGAGWTLTMTMSPYYIAKARIYPPIQESQFGSLGIPGMANLLGNLGLPSGSGSQFAIYETALFSRDVILKLLETRLDGAGIEGSLMGYLQVTGSSPESSRAIAIEVVRDKLSYEMETNSTIATIEVRDENPRVAALLVNRCVDLLNEFDVSTSTTAARERRRFIESRLQEASRSLAQAEKNIEQFRSENLRIGNAPHLLLEQARLQRELEIEQQVYLTLRTQMELAQIEENRQVPVVNVLERAVPPLYPAGPSKQRTAIVATMLTGILLVGFFLVRAAKPRELLEGIGLLQSRI